MHSARPLDRRLESVAWGLFFVWWGIIELFHTLPEGTGAVGFGLILIGLNVARLLSNLPTSSLTLTLGIIALVWGGLEVAGSVLPLPFEIPVFAIVLIVLGVILLGRELPPGSR